MSLYSHCSNSTNNDYLWSFSSTLLVDSLLAKKSKVFICESRCERNTPDMHLHVERRHNFHDRYRVRSTEKKIDPSTRCFFLCLMHRDRRHWHVYERLVSFLLLRSSRRCTWRWVLVPERLDRMTKIYWVGLMNMCHSLSLRKSTNSFRVAAGQLWSTRCRWRCRSSRPNANHPAGCSLLLSCIPSRPSEHRVSIRWECWSSLDCRLFVRIFSRSKLIGYQTWHESEK